MKTRILISLLFFCLVWQIDLAQNVGVNATGTTPNTSAILDLNTGNTFTNPNGKGLIVPNVLLTATNAANPVSAPATSLLVYNTTAAGAGATAVFPGYYYWDGAKWVALGGGGGKDWALLGNAGTTAGTNFLGTTDAVDMVFKTNNTEWMRILSTGNVGIGTSTPGAKIGFPDLTVSTLTDGITWYNPSPLDYGIYKTAGTWVGPNYQQIKHSWQTGIIIDGGSAYGLSGTLLQPTAGNVGVGQAMKAAYNLEVNGTFGYGEGTAGSYRSRTEYKDDAGLMGTQSGFFQTSAPSPGADWHMAPAAAATAGLDASGNATSWWHLMDCRHSNNGNNFALQIAGSFWDQDLYYRKTNNNGAQSWTQLATSAYYGNNIQSVKLGGTINTQSAAYVDMPGMSITFTPKHSTVYVLVSAVSRFTTTTAGTSAALGQAVYSMRVWNNNTGAEVARTAAILADYNSGTNSTVTSGCVAISCIAVAVTAGVSTTLKLQWFNTVFLGAGYLTIAPGLANTGDHCVLTIID